MSSPTGESTRLKWIGPHPCIQPFEKIGHKQIQKAGTWKETSREVGEWKGVGERPKRVEGEKSECIPLVYEVVQE